VAQNGGLTGSTAEDAEMADAEGDDGMDDDMMDKISSSPSIDDGGYSLPQMWPQRCDSLRGDSKRSLAQACIESSSPFVQTPDHFPLRLVPEKLDKDEVQQVASTHHRHLLGEYPGHNGETGPSDKTRRSSRYTSESLQSFMEHCDQYDQYDEHYDLSHFSDERLSRHLGDIPTKDENFPGHLDGSSITGDDRFDHGSPGRFVHVSEGLGSVERELSDEPEDKEAPMEPVGPASESNDIMTIPYESSEDEDDDYEIPYAADSRFVDSGWGGECLQDAEDIDFEFVYALHTFVATVEGQANATKGDTMVLLDDSNSYWWLVRVVKDSSIGE